MDSIVVGLQWGDEGKGKVVQKLSRSHKWIVRFSGGPNAGHTVYHGNTKMVHHLLPSGTNENFLFISRGTLVDLETLNSEIKEISKIYPDIKERLFVSPYCRVITPIEKWQDGAIEKTKGKNSVGTTGRGIGPTVSNDANRVGIRLFDLFDQNHLKEKVDLLAEISNFGDQSIADELLSQFEKIKDRVLDPKVEGQILFEGTQGIMLDPMYGTYPYVTSTPTIPSFAFYGSGLKSEKYEVWGVFKAYTTRVGSGPFPTEIFGEAGDDLRKRGSEFGATTGRPRRCGWIDFPQLEYASNVSNVDHLVMTKSDVLNGLEKVGVCISYDKKIIPYDLGSLKPTIEYVKGWKNLESSEFADFISAIEHHVRRRIKYVSYGPSEEEIFQR
ncbi:MAG: adenylosuccinate synthetase [Athalassotoga sp.]|uniref:adenylosuccinate synthetase n=1 Tax=Athalassotoga sp. TaxID=2022597 RepID=UPI003D01F46D